MSAWGWLFRQARAAAAERGHEGRLRKFASKASVPDDTCVLVAEHGIGDHYLVGAFADAVSARHGVRVWLSGDARLEFIGGMFPSVGRYLPCPADIRRESLGSDRIRGGSFFYAHFPASELLLAVGYRDFHFLDAYRCRLGLPPTAKLAPPRLPSADEHETAVRLLYQAGLRPGKTVVLCRNARSTPAPAAGLEFWPRLAQGLRFRGLDVVLNEDPGVEAPPGLGSLKINLADFRAVIAAAGGICSVRSGLCDLVCDLPCPQAVVYSDVDYWAGSLRDGTTLSRYGLSRPPLEVTLGGQDHRGQSDTIAGYFEAAMDPGPVRAP